MMRNRFERQLQLFAVLCFGMFLAACASMTKPSTPEDFVQTGRAQIAGAYKTIGDLTASGSLSGPQAATFYNKVQVAEKQVNVAATLAASGDTQSAGATLNLALQALTEILAELPKPKPKA